MTQPTAITSVQNPRIKAAVRLRDARHRQKARRIVIDGRREIERALIGGVEIDEVFISAVRAADAQGQRLLSALHGRGTGLFDVSDEVFERLAFGGRSEGIVATAPTPDRSLERLRPTQGAAIAVLVGLEKPGNVGAVMRSADGAGLGGVIVADAGTDLFNPNTIRASLGTVFTLPVAADTGEAVAAWLVEKGYRPIVTRPDAAQLYTEVDMTGPVAIVLGAESTGLSAAWSRLPGTAVRLPMRGAADSLNVSAAAAVLFYEALQQRSG